jgi:hypothetical protein
VIFRVSDFKEDAQKSNKRLTTETITRETKKEGQKKAKLSTTHKNQKKEKASPSCGSKLSHP